MRQQVEDPGGTTWVVERPWWPGVGHLARRYTRWYRLRRARRKGEEKAGNVFDVADLATTADDVFGCLVALIVAVVALLVLLLGGCLLLPFALAVDVVVGLPLLVLLPLLRAAGVVPFVVRARPLGAAGEALTWRVRGLRTSARAVRQLASIIAAGGTPPGDVAALLRGVQD